MTVEVDRLAPMCLQPVTHLLHSSVAVVTGQPNLDLVHLRLPIVLTGMGATSLPALQHHLALKLGDRADHVEHEAAGCGGRIEAHMGWAWSRFGSVAPTGQAGLLSLARVARTQREPRADLVSHSCCTESPGQDGNPRFSAALRAGTLQARKCT